MINKIFRICLFIFVIFLSSSCGYEPLNKSLNSKKLILLIKFLLVIKEWIKKFLISFNFRNQDNTPTYTLKLESNSKINDLSKDQSGNITSYKTTITTYVALIKDQEIIKNKNFEHSFTYPNQSNKFNLASYQREVEDNLIDKIVQDIRLFLNYWDDN